VTDRRERPAPPPRGLSARIQSDLSPNRIATTLARLREEGQAILDLTESNPTRAGFSYPPDLLAPLADARGLVYAPHALGLFEARRSVANEYLRRAIHIDPSRIVLTASTSEAYSLLFKVLCDPGDEVLVPRPSYPLFEHLTRLDGLAAVPYELEYHGTWSIDFSTIERAISPGTRAILIVSPNNPTGSFIKHDELQQLSARCVDAEIAIVADEVFADYPLSDEAAAASGQPLHLERGLVFSLGGLSKSVGLPQLKLGWIALAGDQGRLEPALKRMEIACDTYLSVATPVQHAADDLLRAGGAIRRQIQSRIATNYAELGRRLKEAPACRLLSAEGGWYAVVQVPTLRSEEDLVVDLLISDRLYVHPGYFFDFPRESFLVVSLLTPESSFADGVGRMLRRAIAPQPAVTPRSS
jgi:aspartate/methionine/tyrosine aminotransferase